MVIPLLAILAGLLTFFRVILRALQDPAVKGLLVAVASTLAVGTAAYPLLEGWNFVDSFYFSVTALLTVGFGDYAPQSDAGKLFTVAYLFIGVGLFAATATTIVQRSALWTKLGEEIAEADAEAADTTASKTSDAD